MIELARALHDRVKARVKDCWKGARVSFKTSTSLYFLPDMVSGPLTSIRFVRDVSLNPIHVCYLGSECVLCVYSYTKTGKAHGIPTKVEFSRELFGFAYGNPEFPGNLLDKLRALLVAEYVDGVSLDSWMAEEGDGRSDDE